MRKRIAIALAAVFAFGLLEARAASGATAGGKARQSFAALVKAHPGSSGPAAARVKRSQLDLSGSLLTSGNVARFDNRLNRYLRAHGITPPPATNALSGNQVSFRREFIRQRFTPGDTVGGVFFTTSATPSVPTTAVNVYGFFPVYRFGG